MPPVTPTPSLTVPRGHRGYFDENLNLETGAQILCTTPSNTTLWTCTFMATHANIQVPSTSPPTYTTVTPAHGHMLTDVHIYPHSCSTYACLHVACSHSHTHTLQLRYTHTNSLCPCRHTHVLVLSLYTPTITHSRSATEAGD